MAAFNAYLFFYGARLISVFFEVFTLKIVLFLILLFNKEYSFLNDFMYNLGDSRKETFSLCRLISLEAILRLSTPLAHYTFRQIL